MNNTQIVLSELIKASLFGIEPKIPQDTDWNEVLKEAKAQTVVSLVSSKVPEPFRADWEISVAQSKAHFMRALYEQTKLAKLLTDKKIPFVIIKGTAAAVNYPEPSDRTMGDIDILVTEKYFDNAFALLQENGYKFELDYEDGRDYTFIKGQVVFELHRRYSDKEYDIERHLIEGINNRRIIDIYGNQFPALPDAVNGLLLLDHIRHHLSGGLGIRQIIDFMMFINSVPDNESFKKNYLPLFESAGLGTLARIITKMCKLYFGLPVSAEWCKSADDKTCKELLEKVFSSGNFGRKDPYEYRPMQSFTIAVKKRGIFKTLQQAGLENSGVFKRYKILRPFAWIYQAFRYIKRGIVALFKGEKLTSDITAGKEKSDFFNRLGIK